MHQDDGIVFNGVNASTGRYLSETTSAAELARTIRGEKLAGDDLADIRLRAQGGDEHFGVPFNVDAENLAQAGWGLLVPQDTPDDVLEAIAPLRDLRREQAGDRYYEFTGAAAPKIGESKQRWLARHKMGPGKPNPSKVPYYLLILDDPEKISYQMQYQLDVQYAVGRLSFDTAEAYAVYAESVVAAERKPRPGARRLELFGPTNSGDRATALSSRQLLCPLAADVRNFGDGWLVETSIGDTATKQRLRSLLCEKDGPSVLFTASHGLAFNVDDPLQLDAQGALLCQDWPGPIRWSKPIPADFYLSAADIDGAVMPEVIISFACFGAGTPQLDDFAHLNRAGAQPIAKRSFVARLPQRLLSDPHGHALAFVGHVERAWGCSFTWPGAGEQIDAFSECLQAVLSGLRIGHALESFNQRHADLSAELSDTLFKIQQHHKLVPDVELARMWTANNDARSYVLVGDPAVRAPSAAATL